MSATITTVSVKACSVNIAGGNYSCIDLQYACFETAIPYAKCLISTGIDLVSGSDNSTKLQTLKSTIDDNSKNSIMTQASVSAEGGTTIISGYVTACSWHYSLSGQVSGLDLTIHSSAIMLRAAPIAAYKVYTGEYLHMHVNGNTTDPGGGQGNYLSDKEFGYQGQFEDIAASLAGTSDLAQILTAIIKEFTRSKSYTNDANTPGFDISPYLGSRVSLNVSQAHISERYILELAKHLFVMIQRANIFDSILSVLTSPGCFLTLMPGVGDDSKMYVDIPRIFDSSANAQALAADDIASIRMYDNYENLMNKATAIQVNVFDIFGSNTLSAQLKEVVTYPKTTSTDTTIYKTYSIDLPDWLSISATSEKTDSDILDIAAPDDASDRDKKISKVEKQENAAVDAAQTSVTKAEDYAKLAWIFYYAGSGGCELTLSPRFAPYEAAGKQLMASIGKSIKVSVAITSSNSGAKASGKTSDKSSGKTITFIGQIHAYTYSYIAPELDTKPNATPRLILERIRSETEVSDIKMPFYKTN